jgi:hypothetical protein
MHDTTAPHFRDAARATGPAQGPQRRSALLGGPITLRSRVPELRWSTRPDRLILGGGREHVAAGRLDLRDDPGVGGDAVGVWSADGGCMVRCFGLEVDWG